MTALRIRAVFTLIVLLIVGLLALRSPKPDVGNGISGASDVATYQSILTRLRKGEGYYQVIGEELRRGHYATREIFNWRTPLHWKTLSLIPEWFARIALIALAAGLALATVFVVSGESQIVFWTAVGMQLGVVLMLVVPEATVMGETWSGALLGLSLCASCRRRVDLAVPLGVAALFVRELAAPYCVVATLLALRFRQWREVAGWLAGGACYVAYYAWHFMNVQAHRLPTDLAHPRSWVEFGGFTSLLGQIHWQAWLLVSPMPVTVLALVLVLAGILQQKSPIQVRLVSGTYLAFFLVAGKTFDWYWGTIAWPAWAIMCGYGVLTISQAIETAVRPPSRSFV